MLLLLTVIALKSVYAVDVEPSILPAPPLPVCSLTCANVRCADGTKCVMAEPQDCNGCTQRPYCVQNECDTSCTCSRLQQCVLMMTGCCPRRDCRGPIFTIGPPITIRPPKFTIEPPIFTIGPVRPMPVDMKK
ncbi:hypothetical protein Aduo_014820 [Ancylostoma duodenale]